MLEKALSFAAKAHQNQRRKGCDIPYIMHPLEASVIVSQMDAKIELLIGALLHDTIEDCGVTYEEICTQFNKEVADLVLFQTQSENGSWREKKGNTVKKIKSGTKPQKIVSLGDKLSNMRAIARDYDNFGERLWERFTAKNKIDQGWYYINLVKSLSSLDEYPAYHEFKSLVNSVFGDIKLY